MSQLSMETLELYINEIQGHPNFAELIKSFDYDLESKSGYIEYSSLAVGIADDAVGFTGTKTQANDEELVRALLLLRLHSDYGYPFEPTSILVEKTTPAPGRPKKGSKGSRADIIVNDGKGNPFLFFECKSPKEYSDQSTLEGQLFQASKLEKKRAPYLIWATIAEKNGRLVDTVTTIRTKDFAEYQDWKDAGEPAGNAIPAYYGCDIRKAYANVENPTSDFLPLDETSDDEFFSGLAEELHNVIWGGGGTNNNEVFTIITKLFLCKIFDEKETDPGKPYSVQVKYNGSKLESADTLVKRMNRLYKKAEKSYLGVVSENEAFDPNRIKPSKILHVVSRIEGISLVRNRYEGDILGAFFESIVSHGFTQTKGQFFTPSKLIDFMLDLAGCVDQAKSILKSKPDGRGIHRLPRVIDPSCGVGSFLIKYMRTITNNLANSTFRKSLNQRAQEAFDRAFTGETQCNWARESLYGIENNYDLGLAAKVNMILHGDGSMNTWVSNGLLPFNEYSIAGREDNSLFVSDRNHPDMNEQFDLVLSNPPFSVTFTEDDKKEIKTAFSGELGISEDLFIERWYQLLKPRDGKFCCVLPESVCDTSTERKTRIFMMLRFEILAVISLPYMAFQPYTSVKTCIVYARKRDAKLAQKLLEEVRRDKADKEPNIDKLVAIFKKYDLLKEPIFFAEPDEVGYKRRKGLSDLEKPNKLPEVVARFKKGKDAKIEADLEYGFWVNLESVLKRKTVRFDPKYMWLWGIKGGKIGERKESFPLDSFIRFQTLGRVKKGRLASEAELIELDDVAAHSLTYSGQSEKVGIVESEKISFAGADIALPKLRAYLGKAFPNPPQEAIGSSEWIGGVCKNGVNEVAAAAFLNSERMCQALRCLQSGKQHPRINCNELNDLFIDFDLCSMNLADFFQDLETVEAARLDEERKRDKIFGVIRLARTQESCSLNTLFRIVPLNAVSKGSLDSTRQLIDLQAVSALSQVNADLAPQVSEIGSDKVLLDDADIVFSKLEAYLGKMIANPPKNSIGSSEWVGLKCEGDLNPIVGVYLLSLPELLDAYRMLQSGKRHARVNVEELLSLEIDISPDLLDQSTIIALHEEIVGIRRRLAWTEKQINQFDYAAKEESV